MKCKHCDGTGKCNVLGINTHIDCIYCNGTGEYEPFDADVELDKLYPTEQTNEEWLRTLPVDEQVKEVLFRGFITEKRTAEEFVKWLKETHNE